MPRSLILLFVLLPTLGHGASMPDRYAETVVFDARTVAVETALERFEGDEAEVVVLDVRTPVEHAAGHIAGAVNIDIDSAEFTQRVAELDRNRVYLVHCSANVPNGRSARAMRTMNALGFATLENLEGGYAAWTEAGGPIVSTE